MDISGFTDAALSAGGLDSLGAVKDVVGGAAGDSTATGGTVGNNWSMRENGGINITNGVPFWAVATAAVIAFLLFLKKKK
ncbi:hypothetical protein [Candidatus Enterovibrio escicola]|uniref:hypothetical protein n=2 Tax=Candidatus Enterovibrio escicola TaxID=1927127 RepID=UPI001237FB90|nr:hypothetical protein [Candidatus Enterovibrio escacola]